jgi:hypothetical protein
MNGEGRPEAAPTQRAIDDIRHPPRDGHPSLAGGARSGPPRWQITPFSEIEALRVWWLWEHRIPLGKLTLLTGRPKVGKGLLYSRLIADLTRGALPGDLDGPRAAIIITTEDAPGDTLRPRLEAAGADLSKVLFFEIKQNKDPAPFNLTRHASDLGVAMTEHGASLVVIDPLMESLGTIDAHKSAPVRQALSQLRSVAHDHDCAVLAVHHLNKGKSSDPLLRTEASAAFTQVARGGLLLGHDPRDPSGETGRRRVLAQSSTNLGRPVPAIAYEITERSVLTTDGDVIEAPEMCQAEYCDLTAADLLEQYTRQQHAGSARREIEELVRQELAGGRKPSIEIKTRVREKLGCSGRTIERVAMDLQERGELKIAGEGFPRRTTWELSEDAVAPPRRELAVVTAGVATGESPIGAEHRRSQSDSGDTPRSVVVAGAPSEAGGGEAAARTGGRREW